MKRASRCGVLCAALAVFAFGAALPAYSAPAAAPAGKKSAAELEKEKALQNPYPNDLGPDKIDVAGYPKEAQDGYKLLQVKCARCHSPARPLNSRFVEPYVDPKDPKMKEKKAAAVAALKKSNPELFRDPSVWQIEDGIWSRYVKRMQAKPGCDMPKDVAKQIWTFLTYDSSKRKLGDAAKSWEAHRKDLLAQFKKKGEGDTPEAKKFKKRYEELSAQKDL